MTTAQARDAFLEAVGVLNTDKVQMILRWSRAREEQRVAETETYLKCPRCYGHHSAHGNFDNLCDGCQTTLVQRFPNHESIPHIKAALSKWRVA